jgi:hypothetical protein
VAARLLGVLALFVAVIGVTAWPRMSAADAAMALGSARAHDAKVRRPAPRGEEKAHFASRAPAQAVRARPQDRPDLRLPPLLGAAVVATRDDQVGRARVTTGRGDDRLRLALHEAAPESAGHRAANPVRGPPARHFAAV